MWKKCFSIGVFALGFFSANAVLADIVKDSAAFDKAYIPALALTSQNEPEKTRAAIDKLKAAWGVYASAHRQHQAADEAWKKGFADIDGVIAKADAIVARGTNVTEAHDTLEQVRVTLMQLRRKNGIDYFLDYQTAFHEPMEAIVLTVKGKTPETLDAQDIDKIRKLIPALDARWSALQNARFDPQQFDFDSARSAKLQQLIAAETEAITALKKALAQPDKAALIQHAAAIKAPFSQMFMLFGAFASS
jgi:DNA-binding protein